MNAAAVRRELEGRGAIFSTTCDSEVMVHLLARSREGSLEERLIVALSRVKGGFAVAMLSHDALVAARDPNGFRPLVLGRLDGAWVVASETCESCHNSPALARRYELPAGAVASYEDSYHGLAARGGGKRGR